MPGTVDNTKAYEEWARKAYLMGYSPQYIQAIGELNSWVGGGAESNGLIDWGSGWPVLKQDAYAEFANGDNNIFKRNNATERNAWADERLSIISQEEAMRNANPYGGMPTPYMPMPGMPPYGYPQQTPPPAYGGGYGGNDDNIFKYMMLNDLLRTQNIARNEAAAHPECASGTCRHGSHQGQSAPTLNPLLPLLLMGGGQRRPTGGFPGYRPRPLYGVTPTLYGSTGVNRSR